MNNHPSLITYFENPNLCALNAWLGIVCLEHSKPRPSFFRLTPGAAAFSLRFVVCRTTEGLRVVARCHTIDEVLVLSFGNRLKNPKDVSPIDVGAQIREQDLTLGLPGDVDSEGLAGTPSSAGDLPEVFNGRPEIVGEVLASLFAQALEVGVESVHVQYDSKCSRKVQAHACKTIEFANTAIASFQF